jgi:hypothetical protein
VSLADAWVIFLYWGEINEKNCSGYEKFFFAGIILFALLSLFVGCSSGGNDSPPSFSISGQITNVSGAGLDGVTVSLSVSKTASTTTDASGNYSFSGLSNGAYTVTPSKTGYTFIPANLNITISGADQKAQNFTAPATVAEALKVGDQSGAFPALNRDATVAGPDLDNNGVRDDIDTYINALPDSSDQKSALRQISRGISNAMLVDTTNQSALTDATKKIANAAACAHTQYESATASKKNSEIEKLTVNTKIRFQAYEKFSAAISGTSFVLPQGGGCDGK